jgi:rubrerythrin
MQKILTVDPIDALKMSIQSEKEMQAYYKKAASLVSDDDAKAILMGFARHAEDHRQNSIDMYSKISGKKILFLNLDKRHKLNSLQRCSDDVIDAIRVAKRNERELSDFYATISRRFMQQNLRSFFRQMAAENSQHLALLEASFEDWFNEGEESEEHVLEHATEER